MKAIKPLLILIVAVLCQSCIKNQFKIEVSLPEDVTATYRVIYYASDSKKGLLREDAISVANGKGELLCITVKPTMVYIFTHYSQKPFVCYAERGDDIIITGKNDSPDTWSAQGNDINVALDDWRKANAKSLASDNTAAVNKAVADFVRKNPDNPVSTILMLNYFSRRNNESGFRSLMASLKGDAAEKSWRELTGRSDALTAVPPKPAKVSALLLHDIDNNSKLIKTDSTPSLLYFWNNDRRDYDAAIKSLRSLGKEFTDSLSVNLASICIDPDSIFWRNAVYGDSLKHVVRAWMPLGLADRRLMALAVTRTPFFIVLDNNGSQVYRGENPDSASRSLRSLMTRK